MQQIVKHKNELPELKAWLQKKKPNPPYSWQKRWVVVIDSYILWNDKQREINDVNNIKERRRWNGNLNLMIIQNVFPVKKSKSQRKFVIIAKDETQNELKKYLWKAVSEQDRDFWVESLQQYIKYINDQRSNYAVSSVID